MNSLNPFRRASRASRWQPCAAILLAAFALPAEATLYTVGTGIGCTHADIQSAIDAAEANAGADTIRVSRSLAYTQQALVLATSQSLELLGGYPDCSETFDGVFTIVDGAGGATEPVMRITGNTGAVIVLRHLTIRNGDEDGDGKGGGIYFQGNGSLEIRDSGIINNLAGHGGGIYAEGTGADAELVIGSNVTISGNTARHNGGGVFAEGLLMVMREPDSVIAFNEAEGSAPFTGYGGGLVVNPKSAISAPFTAIAPCTAGVSPCSASPKSTMTLSCIYSPSSRRDRWRCATTSPPWRAAGCSCSPAWTSCRWGPGHLLTCGTLQSRTTSPRTALRCTWAKAPTPATRPTVAAFGSTWSCPTAPRRVRRPRTAA